jgi:hypothetical protein
MDIYTRSFHSLYYLTFQVMYRSQLRSRSYPYVLWILITSLRYLLQGLLSGPDPYFPSDTPTGAKRNLIVAFIVQNHLLFTHRCHLAASYLHLLSLPCPALNSIGVKTSLEIADTAISVDSVRLAEGACYVARPACLDLSPSIS